MVGEMGTTLSENVERDNVVMRDHCEYALSDGISKSQIILKIFMDLFS